MKVGAIFGLYGLKTSRDGFNDWHVSVFELGQTRQARFALVAAQFFVPLIRHAAPSFDGIAYTSEWGCSLVKIAHFEIRPMLFSN
jgi:hypothetical protein